MHRFGWFRLAPRATQGVLLASLCILLVAGLTQLGWLQGLERGVLDALFKMRGPRLPASQITILVVDEATAVQVNRWPLPRRLYADVVRKVTRAGAKTIAFDILFADRSTAADDAILIRACRESGRVVHAAAFQIEGAYNPVTTSGLADTRPLPPRFSVNDKQLDGRSAVWVSSTLPALRDSAAALGNISIYPEMDGALRRIPHLIWYRTRTYPSLALATAAHFLDVKPRTIVAAHDEMKLANRRIPIDENGETWVNWVGGNNSFPMYSVKNLLDGQVPPEALKNRIVLIGMTAAAAFENRATPFSPVQPAIDLQANAIDNILLNRPLREISAAAQWWLLIGFTGLVGLLTAPRRALGGTLWILSLGAALWTVAALALSRSNIYIPVAAPLLAGTLTYAATTAANYRQEWLSNWRADVAAAAIARGGALMASEHDREHLRAEICRAAREALQAREVFLVTDDSHRQHSNTPALYQAARSVGARDQAVFWPAGHEQADKFDSERAKLLKKACVEAQARHSHGLLAGRGTLHTIVVAPLLDGKENPSGDASDHYNPNGALVAIGRDNGRAFTARDALFLQTLAEQATLSLSNLEYYERLRGRVAAADRELQSAYEMLAEQSAKLVTAVESIDDALIVSDENGQTIFVNNAGAAILLNALPALGQSVPDSLRAHGLEELAVLYDDMRAPQQAGVEHGQVHKVRREITWLIPDSDGQDPARRMLAAQLTPLLNGDERLLGAMLVVADVTAQRDLEQMKTDFMSFVAHELRSPLGTILGYASLLHEAADQFAPEQRADMTSTIMHQCRRLNRMIGEMLDMGRLEAGHDLDLRRDPVDLTALCQSVLEGQRATLHNPDSYELRLEADDEPLIIKADPDRMEQIVINLVSNAIKYSPDGGTVSLKLHRQNGAAVMSVADTGMGMTSEQVSQLFQKFYRTPDAQARRIKGTGLGLFLVKQLVEAHGGDIAVASERGHGTTFTVTLPQEGGTA